MTAINAAAHPAHTNFLYFVVKPCGNGESVFSSNYQQFLRDSAQYQSARAQERRALADPLLRPWRRSTRLGVLGWPVAHSRSPQIQNAALEALGLAGWRYQLLPVPPDLFDETVRALGGAGFRGANVTIPHKHAALAAADAATDRARAIGAANTLVFGDDGAIQADNTDAPGLIDALPFTAAGTTALVLGAGGSARAAVWALLDAGGGEVRVWNRNPARAASCRASSARRRSSAPSRRTCSSTARRWGWTGTVRVSSSSHCGRMRSRCIDAWLTSCTPTPTPR